MPQNSASSSNSTYENVIAKLFTNNTNIKKILFLFDADDCGWKGMEQIQKIKTDNPNDILAQKLDYLFYRPQYNDGDLPFTNEIKDYFYLEGFFPTESYHANNNAVKKHFKKAELFENLYNTNAEEDLNFNEINRLDFFIKKLKNNGLKTYFGQKIDKIDNSHFAGFKGLLVEILRKLNQ